MKRRSHFTTMKAVIAATKVPKPIIAQFGANPGSGWRRAPSVSTAAAESLTEKEFENQIASTLNFSV
jgi:hypothetical protein